MAKRSVEDRLKTLQQKRDTLDAEIKKMQAEKAREFRKGQRQREALLGKVIYQLVADEAVINADIWTAEFIHQLMDTQLTRQRDRQLFGLQPSLSVQTALPDGDIGHQNQQQEPLDRAATDSDTTSTQQPAKASQQSLRVSTSQEDLLGEFNL